MADLEARVAASDEEGSSEDDALLAGTRELPAASGGYGRWAFAAVGGALLLAAACCAGPRDHAQNAMALESSPKSDVDSVVGFVADSAAHEPVAESAAIMPVADASAVEPERAVRSQFSAWSAGPCATEEEMLMGLCYERCSILTGGEFPFRQSAWTCCKSASCGRNPFSMFSCCKHNMGWCSGYDITGTLEGKKNCPHQPGACGSDEELFLGLCYKQCSLLTHDNLPYRVAPATCCKRKDATCMIEQGAKDGLTGESITHPNFDVAGGCDERAAPSDCRPHSPKVPQQA